jgi:glycosyltransferase involved in cell wall biosynthesis
MSNIKYSLIIPCYNEEGNIEKLVSLCESVIKNNKVEVVFVDNGSIDNTNYKLSRLTKDQPMFQLVLVEVNRGYGHGIMQGVKACRGEVIGWTHADLQTDPNDFSIAVERFEKSEVPENLFLKGVRYGRPLRDLIFTWGMAVVEFLSLVIKMWDINAQPTVFHRSLIENIVDEIPVDSSLDLFVYYLAIKKHYNICRVRVHFGPRQSGDGSNERLSSKIRYSINTMKYSISLRNQLKKK